MENDKLLSKYENIVLLWIGGLDLILILIGYYENSSEIDSFYVVTFSVGLIIALVLFIVFGVRHWQTTSKIPLNKKYFTTFLWSLAMIPMGIFFSVGLSNSIFDYSEPKVHYTTVIKKYTSSHAVKYSRFQAYNISVESWRDDKEQILIPISKSDYSNISEGDPVVIYSQPGLWGIEHIVQTKDKN